MSTDLNPPIEPPSAKELLALADEEHQLRERLNEVHLGDARHGPLMERLTEVAQERAKLTAKPPAHFTVSEEQVQALELDRAKRNHEFKHRQWVQQFGHMSELELQLNGIEPFPSWEEVAPDPEPELT